MRSLTHETFNSDVTTGSLFALISDFLSDARSVRITVVLPLLLFRYFAEPVCFCAPRSMTWTILSACVSLNFNFVTLDLCIYSFITWYVFS